MEQAIALDSGTSGIRGQLLDLGDGQVIRTCITSRNPVPGANVMDHMSFAIDCGADLAHGILLSAVRDVVSKLHPERLERLSVCGNPIQLSLFEGLDIRDLAYAGDNKLRSENVSRIDRKGHTLDGASLGFPGTEIVIPPAVKHEIGADALAMMLKSGFLDDDMCMVTDYGTNAEMALKVGDSIYTGSAAAGPAMEGQQIRCGMLAAPGAVSDLVRTPQGWRAKVLGEDLLPLDGPMVNLRSGITRKEGAIPTGITGTGVVALVYAGLEDGLIENSEIRGGSITLARGIDFRTEDLREAGKAIGAIRAGHMTLMIRAGVSPDDIRTMYMAGASGTYVDPVKSRGVGMIVPRCTKAIQVGNTSLELAREIALDPGRLDGLNALRDRLVTEHTMFASSEAFSDLYVYEYGYWAEGMPLSRYRRALERYGIDGYLDPDGPMETEKVCIRDIRDIGESLEIIDLGTSMHGSWDCSGCLSCVRGCPEKALSYSEGTFSVLTGRCLGTACRRCEERCPEHKFDYSALKLRLYGLRVSDKIIVRDEGQNNSECSYYWPPKLFPSIFPWDWR
jgi:methylamine methyltransferase corrinoid protein reductive activase